MGSNWNDCLLRLPGSIFSCEIAVGLKTSTELNGK